MALATAVPADKYAWRPAPGVRSFGEVFMHIASEYYVYTPASFGAPRSPVIPRAQDAMPKFEANASKDSVLKHLPKDLPPTRRRRSWRDASLIRSPECGSLPSATGFHRD